MRRSQKTDGYVTKGWRYTIKDDILKIIPGYYCTADDIYQLLGSKYKNHTNMLSVRMYLSQLFFDGKIDRDAVYKKNGNGVHHYIYRRKEEDSHGL